MSSYHPSRTQNPRQSDPQTEHDSNDDPQWRILFRQALTGQPTITRRTVLGIFKHGFATKGAVDIAVVVPVVAHGASLRSRYRSTEREWTFLGDCGNPLWNIPALQTTNVTRGIGESRNARLCPFIRPKKSIRPTISKGEYLLYRSRGPIPSPDDRLAATGRNSFARRYLQQLRPHSPRIRNRSCNSIPTLMIPPTPSPFFGSDRLDPCRQLLPLQRLVSCALSINTPEKSIREIDGIDEVQT